MVPGMNTGTFWIGDWVSPRADLKFRRPDRKKESKEKEEFIDYACLTSTLQSLINYFFKKLYLENTLHSVNRICDYFTRYCVYFASHIKNVCRNRI